MIQYVYIYRYKNSHVFPFDINYYEIIDVYISPQYDRFLISKKKSAKDKSSYSFCVVLYKNLNIVIIVTEKYKYIKNIVQENNWEKFNILSKDIFFNTLENDFIYNITSIVMNIDYSNTEEELVEIKGNRLNNEKSLKNLITNEYGSLIQIKRYSFQPKNYKYLIHVSEYNKIEFSMHYTTSEILEITYKYILILEGIEGEEYYE